MRGVSREHHTTNGEALRMAAMDLEDTAPLRFERCVAEDVAHALLVRKRRKNVFVRKIFGY